MADSDSDSKAKSQSPKLKSTKVNFVLLKQILDDESSEITDSDDQESDSRDNQSNQDINSTTNAPKEKDRVTSSCGPIGKYPVTFSKHCKSKSCQTRLSAFPLFSVPQETEWISDEEDNTVAKKSKRKSQDRKKSPRKRKEPSNEVKSNKKNDINESVEKAPEKTKNADGTRKDFHSEHQLKDSKNPLIQVWIQSKNRLARKSRREERKERRAQRAALAEEDRLKIERQEVSEQRVQEWFKVKRKEARKLWRQNHPKVSPFEMAVSDQNEVSPPPPEYTVVNTFKQKHSSLKSRRCSSGSNSTRIAKDNDIAGDYSTKRISSSKNQTKDNSENNQSSRKADHTPSKAQRPTTAGYTRPDNNLKKLNSRPKTAKPKSMSEDITTKQESAKLMKSLSYDDWLRSKRELDKKKVIERRRELIDSHLDSVISKLGKQRVENIMSSRKHVDTGLKNFPRNAPKPPSPRRKEFYKWKQGHDAPRPEPQGCDCPEAEHIDSDNIKSITFSNPNPTTPGQKADYFCKEVNEKCEELKPSMEKVLAVLDSEMKKCGTNKSSQSTNPPKNPSIMISTTNATCNDTETSQEIKLLLPGTVDENTQIVRPKSARPKSARPKSARQKFVDNTNLTKDEANKKIYHDMDVLGLCKSEENVTNSVALTIKGANNSAVVIATANTDNKDVAMTTDKDLEGDVATLTVRDDNRSTVRSNYFRYGSEA